MSEPFVGEIRMFGGDFAPRGWAFCDGQLLAVSQNDALFSLLGTTYGGDGQTTFGLPDVRGRLPIHQGNGYVLGQRGGEEKVTLTANQMPAHSHAMQGSSDVGNESNPQGKVVAESSTVDVYQTAEPSSDMDTRAVSAVGGSQPHTNVMPFLCINFIISLFGIYPSRD